MPEIQRSNLGNATLLIICAQWRDTSCSCQYNFLQFRALNRASDIWDQLEQLCERVELDPALSDRRNRTGKRARAIGQTLCRPLQGLLPLVVPGQGRAAAQVGALPLDLKRSTAWRKRAAS